MLAFPVFRKPCHKCSQKRKNAMTQCPSQITIHIQDKKSSLLEETNEQLNHKVRQWLQEMPISTQKKLIIHTFGGQFAACQNFSGLQVEPVDYAHREDKCMKQNEINALKKELEAKEARNKNVIKQRPLGTWQMHEIVVVLVYIGWRTHFGSLKVPWQELWYRYTYMSHTRFVCNHGN